MIARSTSNRKLAYSMPPSGLVGWDIGSVCSPHQKAELASVSLPVYFPCRRVGKRACPPFCIFRIDSSRLGRPGNLFFGTGSRLIFFGHPPPLQGRGGGRGELAGPSQPPPGQPGPIYPLLPPSPGFVKQIDVRWSSRSRTHSQPLTRR